MTGGWGREQFSSGQSLILSCVAEGAPLGSVLDALARLVERLDPIMKCSVFLLTDDGKQLVAGAAPSLPAEYSLAIDGITIGPNVGSFGAAAFLRATVIATDIATDALGEAGGTCRWWAETSTRFAGKPPTAFLQKPYRADELLSAIARCVGDR